MEFPIEDADYPEVGDEGVFFVKCRPQDADILDIVCSESRVFIGYPPWRRGAEYDPANMASCVVDLGAAGEDWKGQTSPHRAMTTNRRFAQCVTRGWIVAIPRPGKSKCWLAEIADEFELIDDPPWRTQYLDLRRELGLPCSDEASHVGDVVQSWRFTNPVPVPFCRIPRWITYQLQSRQTIGMVKSFPDLGLDAYRALRPFIDGVPSPPIMETDEIDEIQRRLLTFVSPGAFEHLCVALLQLEHPEEFWWHVGGSGDGGADGLGYSSDWTPTGLLQCKWLFAGGRLSDVREFAVPDEDVRRILASLIHGNVENDFEDAEFWGLERIATLVKKHANHLPMARSLRISP